MRTPKKERERGRDRERERKGDRERRREHGCEIQYSLMERKTKMED
jgi:hypothetical protein